MGSDPAKIKAEALSDFSKFISPMKVRTMKAAGLDIIEDKREAGGKSASVQPPFGSRCNRRQVNTAVAREAVCFVAWIHQA